MCSSSLFFFLLSLTWVTYIFAGKDVDCILVASMTDYRVTQEQLRTLCRDPINTDTDELLALKNVLEEIIKNERLYLIDAEDETRRAPLFYAIESGKSLKFLQQLLEYQVRITNRILLCTIRYGNIDILKLLHQYDADFRQSYHGLSLT